MLSRRRELLHLGHLSELSSASPNPSDLQRVSAVLQWICALFQQHQIRPHSWLYNASILQAVLLCWQDSCCSQGLRRCVAGRDERPAPSAGYPDLRREHQLLGSRRGRYPMLYEGLGIQCGLNNPY